MLVYPTCLLFVNRRARVGVRARVHSDAIAALGAAPTISPVRLVSMSWSLDIRAKAPRLNPDEAHSARGQLGAQVAADEAGARKAP